jgi:hypothetical protein
VCLGAGSARAQTPAVPVAVAKPTYVIIPLEVTVNKPIDAVWSRIGHFCGIQDWAQMQCAIVSGKDDEVGAIRSVGNEIMVGKSQYSYTYSQAPREGRPYNMYHGTLEARAMGPNQTKLMYTIFVDNSLLADDAAREKDRASRTVTFQNFLNNMKILAEGGQLPPRQTPAGGAPR